MIYNEEESRISGADVKYKVFLGQNAFLDGDASSDGIKFKPYIHYNFLYHSSEVEAPAFLPPNRKKSTHPELPATEGTIASMEHYAGLGLQMLVSNGFSLEGSMGFGTYIGSLDKYNSPSTFGIHKENHGFVLSFEIGMGYKFGI